MNIGQLTALLQVNASQLNLAAGALKKFETEANTTLNKVQVKMDALSTSMKTMGTAMSVGLTLPIVGLGVVATKTFREYELNLAHIVGLTGTSREQTAQWNTELLQLAKSTAQGPNKLADALYFIASSGVDSSEAMNVLTVSAQAATAGLGEVNQIADLVTSALNAYKGTGLTAAMVTDQLTAAVREGKAEAPGFAEAIGYAIPIAAQLGVTFDQVAAAMASVSGVGVDVNTAALYLRQVLSDLLKPSHQAEQALNDMGTSSMKLREELASKGLLPLLKTLSVLTETYGKTMADVFPEVRALTEVLALTGKNVEHVSEIFDLVANSVDDMKTALVPATETLDFKFKEAVTNTQIALIKLGEALKGPVSSALNWLSKAAENFANWFGNLDPVMQGFIVTIAGLVAVAGPLALVLSVLSKSILVLIGSITSGVAPVMAFVVAIGFLVKKTIEAINYMTELDRIHKKFNQDVTDETTNINVLFSALEKTNGSSAVRRNIIEKINTQYGEYLPHLLTEKTSLSELLTIQESLTNVMKAKLALTAQQKSIESVLSAQIKREQQELQKFSTTEAPAESWLAALDDLSKTMPLLNDFSGAWKNVAGDVDESGRFQIKTVADLAAVTGRSYDNIVGNLQELIAERVKDKKSLEDIEKRYSSYSKILDNLFKTPKATTLKSSVDVSGYSKAADVLQKYNLELSKIDLQTQALGRTEQTIKDQINATKAALDAFAKENIKTGNDVYELQLALKFLNMELEVGDEISKKAKKYMDEQSKSTERLENRTIRLQNKLAILAYENSLVGDSWDASKGDKTYTLLTGRLQIYRQELQNLFELQNAANKPIISPESDKEVQEITGHILALQEQLVQLDASKYVTQNLGNAFRNLASAINSVYSAAELMGESIGGGAKEFAQWIDLIVGTISTVSDLVKFIQALTVASKADAVAKSTQAVSTTIATTATTGLSVASVAATASNIGLTASNMALAAALTSTAVAGAMAASSWIPFPGNLAAMTTSAATLLTTLASTMTAAQAITAGVKLADGGIVPPGYPNDTYPAFLTSGEMVTPPGKLPQNIGGRDTSDNSGSVEFEIRGDVLYGILKKYNTKLQTY